ncbi:hypothetical protein [Limnoglobus roseus]|uniref:Uncharacterized protein n=1 Tax=Limnoglobus roseus TaxID=2598579 RepID=A0A5C1A6J6_9BACT|nr:hypothetical protein [Limnoglobus roseus]QEL14801.1 hypothetical protein PX52LOC_01696 [Limnoglobus roseus]
MTFTSNPITVKDSAAADKSIIAYNDGTSSAFAHPLLDSTGAIISPATSGNQTAGNASLATIATNTSGLATATAQAAGNSSLASIATNTTGAATAAAQATGNSSLASVATNTANIPAKGQATMANSLPIAIASDQPAVPVAMTANTAGGTSTFCANGAAGGNALLTSTPVAVKASAGNLYGFDFVNTGNAAAYVQIFDLAVGSVTLGTTAPKLSKWVPAGGSWEEKFGGEGKISFANAIVMAATSTPSGSTTPATGILANVTFK